MKKTLLTTLALLSLGLINLHAHGHLYAGSNGGTLVLFDESNGLMPTINPETYHLVWRSSGPYSGTYSLDSAPRPLFDTDFFTFAALEAETGYPEGAPLGSQIWIRMTLLSGPTGGTFSFWDTGALAPTKTFLADGSSGAFSYILSEPSTFGVPPELQDPQGHLHGRAFTASLPGEYLFNFQLFDASGLGAGGGPLIPNSPNYTFQFSVVPEPAAASLTLVGFAIWAISRRRKN